MTNTMDAQRQVVFKFFIANLLTFGLFFLAVPTLAFILIIFSAPFVGITTSTILVFILGISIGLPMYVNVVKKIFYTWDKTPSKLDERFYITLNVIFLLGLISFYVFFVFHNDYGIVFPTSRHTYQYDMCALRNGAGHNIQPPVRWSCTLPGGQNIQL